MDDFFMIITLLALAALVVGIIKPNLVIRWGEKRTRGRVLLIYGSLLIIGFIGFGQSYTPERRAELERQRVIAQQEKEQKVAAEAAEKQKKAEEKERAAREKHMQEVKYYKSAPNIDYQAVARFPDQYKGKPIAVLGQVIQVVEDGNDITMRINTKRTSYGWSGDTVLVKYRKTPSEGRILENDVIKLFGVCEGVVTYEAVMGNKVTIPAVTAKFLDS